MVADTDSSWLSGPKEYVVATAPEDDGLPVFEGSADEGSSEAHASPDDSSDEEPSSELEETAQEDALALEEREPGEQDYLRLTFGEEASDPDWTREMEARLQQQADSSLGRGLDIASLDCRESVCRLVVSFESDKDLEAFREAESADLEFSYQDLDPERRGQAAGAGLSFEVLVQESG